VLLVAGFFLWPAALGGSTSYLGTQGVSMQPLFHTGDLAVLRTADHYSVGDVVGYHSTSLNTTVLHRIVSAEAGAFTTQGDSNTWLDPDHPRADQIIGRLWVAVPYAGRLLPALHSPWLLTSLGLVAIVVTGSLGAGKRRRARARRPRPTISMSTRSTARQVALGAAAVAAVAAVGGVALFLVPTTETVADPATITARGTYGYTGAADTGITYPDGRIGTGDPVWLQLSHDLTVSLEQTLDGADLVPTGGSLRLDVSIATPDGWSADLPAGPTATADGVSVTATVPLDLPAVTDLVDRHYAEVGTASGNAVLTVTPVGQVTGTAAGLPFSTAAPSPLSFSLSNTVLRPADDGAEVMTPTASVEVSATTTRARQLEAFGLSVPLGAARGVACLVLAAALVTLLATGSIAFSGPRGEAAGFLLRHRDRILPVTALPQGAAVVELPDGAALHRLAQRLDTLVLHHEGPDGHTFLVQDGATTYRFRVAAPAPVAPVVRGGSGRHAPSRRTAPSMTALLGRLAQL